MTAPRFVAACAQMRSGRDPLRNRDDAVALVREAAAGRRHYVQTPEMTSLVERSRADMFEKVGPEERDPTLRPCGRPPASAASRSRSARSPSRPATRSPTGPS